ncbi:pyridoxal phosphate-dependent transferase [Pelagophyceae sp. CCMP2097]|nr:pyridoxal phosphate-dependent transferase [Pelagophyceae sp. CCMP2097]
MVGGMVGSLALTFGWSYLAYVVLGRVYRVLITLKAMDPTAIAARLSAPLLRSYSLTGKDYFNADGCDDEVAAKRQAGAELLSKRYDALMGKESKKLSEAVLEGLSDIRFTDTNRVPFQFQAETRRRYSVCTITASSRGPVLTDVDGQQTIDVSGSYGVNVCGYDVYKGFVDRAWSRTKALGPNVLGPVHPIIADVLPLLKKVSGKPEVSFHMSGTEAVMCAVRLCRFNTRRNFIVQFAGAYHGWWDGVQPGPGSERANADVLYLKDMSPDSMRVIRARAGEIACVCVSPLQGLNPGKPPPSDMVLLDAKVRSTAEKGDAYRTWLHELKALCTASDVPLLFDEVYTGFRMAPGGAQEYYGVQADVVCYGKTLGGGLANGVVCGPSKLMRRFDPAHPLRVAYVIGTFAAAPLTLATMAEFLSWNSKPETHLLYAAATQRTDAWVHDVNKALSAESLPMRVDNLTTVWTVLFTQPGRYHWMFQYYLRAEGLTLSWVGTGRCLFSLDFTPEDYETVKQCLLRAARVMQADGWWAGGVESKAISKKIGFEMVTAMVKQLIPGKANP